MPTTPVSSQPRPTATVTATVPTAPLPTATETGGEGGEGSTDDEPEGQGGEEGNAGGAGGMSVDAGGMGGETASGGAGGEAPPGDVNPSPGCGQAERPANGQVYVNGESWLIFPEAYDGSTPMPVLFGFHGCGSGNRGDGSRTEYLDATRNNVFEDEYVVAAPISSDSGGCWNYGNDIPRVRQLYDDLINNHCVDMNRVFATGHSSGAYFAVATLEEGHSEDAQHLSMRGMAPVAASPVNNHSTPMPVMYIENPADTERGDDNAPTVVAGFREANQCSESSQPYDGAESCNSSSGGAMVDAGCIVYDDCAQPTVWCSHNDQAYGTTGHGIPCFAAQAMDQFFKSL